MNPFRQTGSEIHFGFVRANSTTVRVREIVTAIDNWRVTIHPEGEPGTADLAIAKTADVLEVSPGGSGSDRTNFSITVSNRGPEDVDTVVTDLLPAGMQIPAGESATASVGSYDESTGEWTVGILAATSPPTEVTLEIPVEVLSESCITNTATVAPASGETVIDSNTANNSASVLIVASPNCGADLSISGIVNDSLYFFSPNSSRKCLDVVVDVTVTNQGPSTAEGVRIVAKDAVFGDTLPAWDSCESSDSYTWPYEPDEEQLGTLSVGESVTLSMLKIIELLSTGGDIDFKVDYTVQSDVGDPDTGNNQFVLESTIQRAGGGGSGGYCFIHLGANTGMDR